MSESTSRGIDWGWVGRVTSLGNPPPAEEEEEEQQAAEDAPPPAAPSDDAPEGDDEPSLPPVAPLMLQGVPVASPRPPPAPSATATRAANRRQVRVHVYDLLAQDSSTEIMGVSSPRGEHKPLPHPARWARPRPARLLARRCSTHARARAEP